MATEIGRTAHMWLGSSNIQPYDLTQDSKSKFKYCLNDEYCIYGYNDRNSRIIEFDQLISVKLNIR